MRMLLFAFFLILIFNHSFSSLNSSSKNISLNHKKSLVSSPYFNISVLLNSHALFQWKKNIAQFYKNHHQKIKILNFNDMFLKLYDFIHINLNLKKKQIF